MEMINKEEVLNTITLFNTIGQEIQEILVANHEDESEFLKFMEWEDTELQTIERISVQTSKNIESFLNIQDLGIYLISFQKNYFKTKSKSIESFNKNKKIFRSFKPILSLLRDDFNDGIDQLADISDFFGVEDESGIFEIAETNVARYRAPGFEPDTINLFAWLRRGYLDFNKIQILQYNKEALSDWVKKRDWVDLLNNHEYFLSLPNIFKDFGVALVFTPHLEKTVFGAVRWFKGRPLIQISDREKNLATCWYTLFHEIGHVLLHENDNICEGSITESKNKKNRKESDAIGFASENLFGGNGLRKYLFEFQHQKVNDSFVIETSERFNTHKMFVAYWMIKAQVSNLTSSSLIPKISFV